jgi:hypothetical protein
VTVQPTGAWSPAKDLAYHVAAFIKREYGPFTPPRIPPGLRLELGHAARYEVYADLHRYTSPGADPMAAAFAIPVEVNPDLPERGWRLVIVTEDELEHGTLPEAAP